MSRLRLSWIVAGSLVLGFVLAVFAVAVPFAGARENVIAGGVLQAFALGWAALAIASARWTDRPQRWAVVPAVAMGFMGVVLLAWPGSVQQEWLAWTWPLATLVLVQWMVGHAQRQIHGRTAWLLNAVFIAMTVVSLAALAECVLESSDRRSNVMPGQLVDVGGGRRVHMRVMGEGSVTVVLISGFGDLSAEWAHIAPAVAEDARVCSFDLAGRGWSDDARAPQDGAAIATDIHTALANAHIPTPYVVVGHSLGGLYAMIFAAQYPADVAGMVLLDSTHPDQYTRIKSYPTLYEIYRRVSATFPSLARLCVGRIAYRANFDPLPRMARDEERVFWSTARLARSQRDEWSQVRATMKQAHALPSFGSQPLIVLTAMRGSAPGWLPLQEELSKLSHKGLHRVLPQATHGSLIYDKKDAGSSVHAIRDVVRKVRDEQLLPNP